jgi:hypothetical protein
MVYVVRSFRKRYCGAIVAITTSADAAQKFIETKRDEDPYVAFLVEEHEVLDTG